TRPRVSTSAVTSVRMRSAFLHRQPGGDEMKNQAILLLGALALLMLACAPGAPSHALSPTPTLRPAATPSAVPAGPSPAAAILDPVPANCTVTRPPHTRAVSHCSCFPGSITLLGKAPVWIPQPYFPTTLHLNEQGYTPWPGTKIVWEIGPNAPSSLAVRVQITNRATGQIAWWGGGPPDQSQYRPAQTLVLDPAHPAEGPAIPHGSDGTWAEWGSVVYLPDASCYTLQV